MGKGEQASTVEEKRRGRREIEQATRVLGTEK